jgi:hypothetical protein
MNRRRFLLGSALVPATALLSGCGTTTKVTVRRTDSRGNKTEIEIIQEWLQQGDQKQNFLDWLLPRDHVANLSTPLNVWAFDAGQASLDLAQSNVGLDAVSGASAVTLFQNGLAIASNVFSWYRSGSALFLANPAGVNSWVRQFPSVTHFVAQTTGVVVNNVPGVNLVAASSRYSGSVIGMGSTSWVTNESAPPINQW